MKVRSPDAGDVSVAVRDEVDKIVAWVRLHGRLPNRRCEDDSEECRLAKNYSMLKPRCTKSLGDGKHPRDKQFSQAGHIL